MFSLQRETAEGKIPQFTFNRQLPTPLEGKVLFLFPAEEDGAVC